MIKIERHQLDIDFCCERYQRECLRLPEFLGYARKHPNTLSQVESIARDIVRYGSVVAPMSPEISRSLKIGTEANTALFAIHRAGTRPVEIRLDQGTMSHAGPINESLLHGSRWLTGMWQAMICRDASSIKTLCQIPTRILRQSTTSDPEYRYLWIEAIQGYWNGAEDTAKLLIAAMEATNPDRADILVPNWTLHIDVPAIQLFFYAVSEDPTFQSSLIEAVEHHKKYWNATAKRRMDPTGFVSLELSAITNLASDRNVSFDIHTEYLLSPPLRFGEGAGA